MAIYEIYGGTPLSGTVTISGAKNAAVAILPAALLVKGKCRIENVPDISDVRILLEMLRGMGASLVSAIVSLVGSCLLRVIWIYTVFAQLHQIEILYISYPATWLITTAAHFTCFVIILHKRKRALGMTEVRV